jgi:hypothetical protein
MGSKRTPMMILMMVVTLVCAAIIVPAALGALLPPSAFAQQVCIPILLVLELGYEN